MAQVKKKKTAAKKPAKVSAKKKPTAKAAVKKAAPKAKKPLAKKTVAAKKPVAKKTVKAVKPAAKKPVKKAAPKAAAKPKGLPEQMLDAALKVLDERQAEQIVTIPLAGRSTIADYMIIASGRAGRQVVAIADYLREAFFKLGVRSVRIEGQAEANWILVDAGDVIIHLFRPEVRRYYDIDAIWSPKAKGVPA